jgi:hypothetical protein
MITRGLVAGEPEFEDPEIQAGLLEYLNQVELVVDRTEWRRLFNEVQFNTSPPHPALEKVSAKSYIYNTSCMSTRVP